MNQQKINRGKDIEALSNGRLLDIIVQNPAGLERLLEDVLGMKHSTDQSHSHGSMDKFPAHLLSSQTRRNGGIAFDL